jgi:hypothetical protein
MWKWSAIVGAIAAATYLLLWKYDIIPPNKLSIIIVIGLATTAIGNLLGYFFAGFKSDLSKILARHSQQFRDVSKAELQKAFNEDFWAEIIKKTTEKRTVKLPSVDRIYRDRLEPLISHFHERDQRILSLLEAKNEELTNLVRQYVVFVSQFYDKFTGIFSDPDQNVQKIKAITKRIKEKAIEPSFALLEDTTTDLEKVRDEIQLAGLKHDNLNTHNL